MPLTSSPDPSLSLLFGHVDRARVVRTFAAHRAARTVFTRQNTPPSGTRFRRRRGNLPRYALLERFTSHQKRDYAMPGWFRSRIPVPAVLPKRSLLQTSPPASPPIKAALPSGRRQPAAIAAISREQLPVKWISRPGRCPGDTRTSCPAQHAPGEFPPDEPSGFTKQEIPSSGAENPGNPRVCRRPEETYTGRFCLATGNRQISGK